MPGTCPRARSRRPSSSRTGSRSRSSSRAPPASARPSSRARSPRRPAARSSGSSATRGSTSRGRSTSGSTASSSSTRSSSPDGSARRCAARRPSPTRRTGSPREGNVFFSERFLLPRPILRAITARGAGPPPRRRDRQGGPRARGVPARGALRLDGHRPGDRHRAGAVTCPGSCSRRTRRASCRTRSAAAACTSTSTSRTRERELAIVRLRAPGAAEALARAVVAAVAKLRTLDLRKPPSISETLDWVRALALLGGGHARRRAARRDARPRPEARGRRGPGARAPRRGARGGAVRLRGAVQNSLPSPERAIRCASLRCSSLKYPTGMLGRRALRCLRLARPARSGEF